MKEERQSETLYEKFHRDWVDMFTASVNITKDATCTPGYQQSVSTSPLSDKTVSMGWALPKPYVGSSKLTYKVKNYLTDRFDVVHLTIPEQQFSFFVASSSLLMNFIDNCKGWSFLSNNKGLFRAYM